MKCITCFESCLIIKNIGLFQEFVHGMIECEEKTKVLLENTKKYFFCGNCFPLFYYKCIRDFHRLVNNSERTITKWFQFVRNLNSFKFLTKNSKFIGNGWIYLAMYKPESFFVQFALINI